MPGICRIPPEERWERCRELLLLADPDPLYLCPIYFYVKSFILQSTLLANRSLSRLC